MYVVIKNFSYAVQGFPGGVVVENPPANTGGVSQIPELGRFPGVGNGHPPQYSCLETPWTVEPGGYRPWGYKESDMSECARSVSEAANTV